MCDYSLQTFMIIIFLYFFHINTCFLLEDLHINKHLFPLTRCNCHVAIAQMTKNPASYLGGLGKSKREDHSIISSDLTKRDFPRPTTKCTDVFLIAD